VFFFFFFTFKKTSCFIFVVEKNGAKVRWLYLPH